MYVLSLLTVIIPFWEYYVIPICIVSVLYSTWHGLWTQNHVMSAEYAYFSKTSLSVDLWSSGNFIISDYGNS